MTLSKLLLPLLASSAFLGGCVYEEVNTGYREPRRVYHSGYAEREVVVVNDRPRRYRNDDYGRDDYRYRNRPTTVYQDPYVYGGGYVAVPGHRGDHNRGESYKERQERQVREAQRAQEDRHDRKDDDDHKKKKKKKNNDD